jgi:Calponin homology (CH) domain
MEWLKSRTKHHPDVHVTNFTDSLADGRAFMALLNGAGNACILHL